MKDTYFLDKSFIIATILNTKYYHFKESYVTLKECNIISDLLKKLLKDSSLDVNITDTIDKDYFEIMDGIFVINCKEDIENIKDRYFESISSLEIRDIIWNDLLIYNYLCDIKSENEKLSFVPIQLDKIVERILEEPKTFYEHVARELSKEEYDYLKRKVEDKSCQNCIFSCSSDEKRYLCENWSNDQLIGKAKVKTNNIIVR